MPDWSMIVGGRWETIGADTANSRGTSINVAGSANTKGAWTQLIASTAFQAAGIIIRLGKNTALADILVDIGVGGSGSERVIVENLLITGRDDVAAAYQLPVVIPAGSRLTARCQASSVISLEVYVSAMLPGAPFLPGAPLGRVTTYGAATADSGGVGIDPGGTAHTKGSYAQITASTTNRLRLLLVGLGIQTNNVMINGNALLDIAVGGAGSEQIILPNIGFAYSQNEQMVPATLGPFPVNIPAGTRLAARAQSSITDATDRLFDVVLYGID